MTPAFLLFAVETIVVTGAPLPQAEGAAAAGLVVAEGEALATASGRSEDALRRLAGVQLFRESGSRQGNPTAEGATARGLAGNAATRLLVLRDGVPIADPFFGSVSWTGLSDRPIASVQLDRGGGDPAAGPGGVAGTLRIETGTIEPVASMRLGSRDSFEVQGRAALPVGSGRLGFSALLAGGDGFPLVAPADAGAADVDSRYRQWAVGGRALLPLGPATELQASLGAFDDRRRRGLAGADVRATGGDAALRLVHGGPWAVEAAAWAQIRDFSTRTLSLSPDRAQTMVALDQRATPAEGMGVRLELRPPPVGPLAFRAGADLRLAQGETVEAFRFIAGTPTRLRRAGGRTRELGLFAEARLAAGNAVQLVAGGRLDGWRLDRGRLVETDLVTGLPILAERAPDRTGTAAGGRLLASWQPWGALRLRAAASASHRLPTLNELHRPFRIGNDVTAANSRLDPERARHLELGADWEPLTTTRVALTLFDSRLAGAVANLTLGEGPGIFPGVGFLPPGGRFRQRANLPAIASRGVEVDARADWRPWQLQGSLALTDARVAGGALDGRRPAQVARWMATAAIGRAFGAGEARLLLRHVGPRFEDDVNERRLRPTTSLDVIASWPISSRLALSLAGENLLDARNPVGFSGAVPEQGQPRTLWLGIGWASG